MLRVAAGAGADFWLDNRDLRPLAPADRVWTFWTYTWFWFSAAATVANWYSPTVFLSAGLSIWESLLCHFGGQILAGICMVFTGFPGSKYHVGYPVLARTSFGVLGALWPVLNRAVMSIIWNGVNLVQGGQCIYTMLHAIFPSIARLHNVMQPGDALNSGSLIGFMVFWLAVVIFSLCSIRQLKVLLYIKVAVFLTASVAMLAWLAHRAHGIVSVAGIPPQPGQFGYGVSKSWVVCRFVLLSWANCSTFIANAADFQRYARKPTDAILGQAVGFPIGNLVVSMFGLFVGSTSIRLFGQAVWNPITYLDMVLTADYSAANRAAAFFLALMFAYSAAFSCVYENLLPAGNDLAALVPRYLNVRRASLLASLLSIACVPWKILGASSNFVSWLSAYQIFLSSITGILVAHFFVLERCHIRHFDDLYVRQGSVYYFYRGFNWRAYLAYFLGLAPNFYGFLGNLGLTITPGATKFYYFAYPVGLVVSFASYLIICRLSPPPELLVPESTVTFEAADQSDRSMSSIADKF